MSTFELRQEMKKLAQVEKEFKVIILLTCICSHQPVWHTGFIVWCSFSFKNDLMRSIILEFRPTRPIFTNFFGLARHMGVGDILISTV